MLHENKKTITADNNNSNKSSNKSSNENSNENSDVLEWSLIQNELASRCRSPLGKSMALGHLPFTTPSEALRLRQRVQEAQLLIEQSPLHGYVASAQNPSELFERASREGVLAPQELWICGHFMETLGLLGSELRHRKEQVPHWSFDFELAPKTPSVCSEISRSVSSTGDIFDSASPELARLRREKVGKKADFESMLSSKIKEWSSSGLLQDDFYDLVEGRYVVPVKVEQQSKLGGTLIGKSNTGQSVFIEPVELMGPNNVLKEIDIAIRAEEFRILRKLSQIVGSLSHSYQPWIAPVAELDFGLAAAILAKDWKLHCPTASTGTLELPNLFHPGLLLQNIQIVKNSVHIASGGRGILISGPNTGGKTVLLKALALSCNMARAGIFVPTDAGAKIPHYSDVLAFIGDAQNLSTGLSSFSGQIRDMKQVLADKRKPLLIVIDEMLSSTDPEEASALAQALIEEFVRSGHHLLVTSHFSELSLKCKQNPNIAVAAMEFDQGKPTYRLRPDELGSSHALEVAEKLGIPEEILSRAKQLLSTAKLDYEKAVQQLKDKEKALEEDFLVRVKELESEKTSTISQLKEESEKKISQLLIDSKQTLEQTIKSLSERFATLVRQGSSRALEENTARLQRTADLAVEGLEKKSEEVKEQLGLRIKEKSVVAKKLEPSIGARVKVRSMGNATGTILELNEENQKATLQVGAFRFEKYFSEFEVLEPPKQSPTMRATHSAYSAAGYSSPVSTKLDLRGKRYDEALSEAERYIDQAFRSGASMVTVVTGHGTGALKKGLRDLLSTLPYIKEFRPERTNDDGATLIEFDR